jgi:enediyne biosynthesis protein E4
VDILVVDSEGRPLLLHNETPQSGHFLGVRLIGGRSPRDGQGTLVRLHPPDGKPLLRHAHSDGSYLSASDARIHFGLGRQAASSGSLRLTVRWPSGRQESFPVPAVDCYLTVREGTGTAVSASRDEH